MEALAHGPEHLAEAGRLGSSDAQCPGHLLDIESEDLADSRRSAEHAGRAGDVPADVVVRGIDSVADPAFDLDAKDEGVQELSARHRQALRQRQERRGNGTCRMDDGLQMRVVEIEDVARNAVEERGIEDVDPFGAAQNAALRRPENGLHRSQRAVDRLVTAAADGAARPVHQRAQGFFADGVGMSE